MILILGGSVSNLILEHCRETLTVLVLQAGSYCKVSKAQLVSLRSRSIGIKQNLCIFCEIMIDFIAKLKLFPLKYQISLSDLNWTWA